MGILHGTVTARRFRVVTPLPDGYRRTIAERVARRAFREPEPDELEPVSGWARVENPMVTEMDAESCQADDYVVLAYREERRVVQPIRLRGAVLQAEAELRAERGTERLGKAELKELRERVLLDLAARTTPRVRVVEVGWRVGTGLLLIFSTSSHLVAEARALFERTFEVETKPLFPYLLAEDLGVTAGLAGRLDAVRPALFAPEVAARVKAAAEARGLAWDPEDEDGPGARPGDPPAAGEGAAS